MPTIEKFIDNKQICDFKNLPICNEVNNESKSYENLENSKLRMSIVRDKMLAIQSRESTVITIGFLEEQKHVKDLLKLSNDLDEMIEKGEHGLSKINYQALNQDILKAEENQNLLKNKFDVTFEQITIEQENADCLKNRIIEIQNDYEEFKELFDHSNFLQENLESKKIANQENLACIEEIYLNQNTVIIKISEELDVLQKSTDELRINLLDDENSVKSTVLNLSEAQEDFIKLQKISLQVRNISDEDEKKLRDINDNIVAIEKDIALIESLEENLVSVKKDIENDFQIIDERLNSLDKQTEAIDLNINNLLKDTKQNITKKYLKRSWEVLDKIKNSLVSNVCETGKNAFEKMKVASSKYYETAADLASNCYEKVTDFREATVAWVSERIWTKISDSPLTYLFGAILTYHALKIFSERPVVCLVSIIGSTLFYVIKNPQAYDDMLKKLSSKIN